MNLAIQSPHALVLSPQLIDDVRRVLRYDRIKKKHGIAETDIDDFADFLLGAGEVVVQPTLVPIVAADPDDDIVIATAVDGKAEVIGTRDQHFADT